MTTSVSPVARLPLFNSDVETGIRALILLEALHPRACNIAELTWFDYAGYPSYPQLWGEFTHHVTILDLLFNCGIEARRYMRYVGG